MKKMLTILLTLALMLSMAPAAMAEDGGLSAELSTDGLREELGTPFSGGGGFQVSAVEEGARGAFLVTYEAAADCTLVLTMTDDPVPTELARVETAVSAGTQQIPVDMGLAEHPVHYRVTAALYDGDRLLSEEFTYCDHTVEYEQFLAVTPDDEAFAGQTVLDLGTDSDGRSNFAVVREDVHVVTVPSIEDVSAGPALMGDGTGSEYLLPVEGEELAAGDKILILPDNDPASAVSLIAGSVEYPASLMDGSGGGTAAVSADVGGEITLEEFYEYIRLNADFSAGTDDLDTSSADPIVEFEEGAQLSSSSSKDFGGSKSFSIPQQNFCGVRLNDTLTLAVNGKVEVNYSLVILKKIVVTTTLQATNVFTIDASGSVSPPDRSVRLGTIPVAGIPGLSLNIPVDLVFSANFSAKFHFSATQSAKTTIQAGYDSGSCWCTASSSATSGKELETEARASASLGVKAGLEISALGFAKADVSGEVGVKAVAVAQSINSTATYRHTCTACLDVSLYVYARPSFSVRIFGNDLAGKAGDSTQSKIMGFYVSYKGGRWTSGYGTCPNREYLVTITVVDGATNNPLSGVTVDRNMGTTGADGKVSGFFKAGSYYTFSLKRGGYEDSSVGVYVGSSPVSEKVSLYPKSNNEDVMYSMEEWAGYTDDTLQNYIEQYREEGIQVNLAAADDLELLAAYVISGKPTADIVFYMNTTSTEMDLSGVEWIPIGNTNHPFEGEFNGSKIDFKNLSGANGFFGVVGGNAWVHDLTLSSAALDSSAENPAPNMNDGSIGAVANVAQEGAEISDVSVSGSVSGKCAGGIAGQLKDAAVRNSCATRLTVTGTECAGGIAGAYTANSDKAGIANCYAVAETSGGKAGVLCGTVSAAVSGDAGLQYVYYPDSAAAPAFGEIGTSPAPLAFALSDAQAKGLNSTQVISDDPAAPYANAPTLLEALNLWYADFGAYKDPDSVPDESGVQQVPEADPQDRYNHWFADNAGINGGYPLFAARGAVYPLTVHYSYEDGSEAYPTVVLYYEARQKYVVDSYKKEGYYTNDVTYTGIMPDYSLDFFVVYYKETEYAGSAKDLSPTHAAAAGKTYRVGDAADLRALAAYVAGGGSTEAVQFNQTGDIAVDKNWTGIGSADHPFRGSYEGSGFAVTGLPSSLFGYTDGAAIRNVSLAEVDIRSQADVGALAVSAVDSSIANCSISGELVSAGYAGGIVSRAKDSRFENCSANMTVQGGSGAGGAAAVSEGADIVNCSFTGAITAASGNAGGLAGTASGGALENSFAYAAVNGGEKTGGLAGSSRNLTMSNVFFAGTLEGSGNHDAITAEQTNGEFTNVFYPSGLTTAVPRAEAFQPQNAGGLAERLNDWVRLQNSARYYTWAMGDAAVLGAQGSMPLPVHSLPYENWLLDLSVENGVVSYTFDEYHYASFRVLIALYTADGRMLSCRELPAGESSFEISEKNCAYARAFVFDENMSPVEEAVSSPSTT